MIRPLPSHQLCAPQHQHSSAKWARCSSLGSQLCSLPCSQYQRLARQGCVLPPVAAAHQRAVQGAEAEALASAYNREMKAAMGWGGSGVEKERPFEYHFTLYYHEVYPGLFCGAQPRSAEDVHKLVADERIGAVINLQQDKDPVFWNVDLDEVIATCDSQGITHIRKPARDFDPHSLRKTIPSAVQAVNYNLQQGRKVYVHCTAGLGRAPAVCIAYLYWFTDMQLDEAYDYLTRIRPCGPKKDAIRGATYDCLDTRNMGFDAFATLPQQAWATLSSEDREVLQGKLKHML